MAHTGSYNTVSAFQEAIESPMSYVSPRVRLAAAGGGCLVSKVMTDDSMTINSAYLVFEWCDSRGRHQFWAAYFEPPEATVGVGRGRIHVVTMSSGKQVERLIQRIRGDVVDSYWVTAQEAQAVREAITHEQSNSLSYQVGSSTTGPTITLLSGEAWVNEKLTGFSEITHIKEPSIWCCAVM